MPLSGESLHDKNETISQAQKTRTRMACVRCRASRTKCDGQPDSCQRCLLMQRTDCHYESVAEEDKLQNFNRRRKNSRYKPREMVPKRKKRSSIGYAKKVELSLPKYLQSSSPPPPLTLDQNDESTCSCSCASLCFSSCPALLTEINKLNYASGSTQQDSEADYIPMTLLDTGNDDADVDAPADTDYVDDVIRIDRDMSSSTTPGLESSKGSSLYTPQDMHFKKDENFDSFASIGQDYSRINFDLYRDMISKFVTESQSQGKEVAKPCSLQKRRLKSFKTESPRQRWTLTQERFDQLIQGIVDPAIGKMIELEQEENDNCQVNIQRNKELFLDLSDIDRSDLLFIRHSGSSKVTQ